MTPTSVYELYNKVPKKLTTGCISIDEALGGGIDVGQITEIAGEAGTAKSQFAMQLCYTVQLPTEEGGLDGEVAYISTEGVVPTTRLQQIIASRRHLQSNKTITEYLSSVYIIVVHNLDEQWDAIMAKLSLLIRSKNIKLVIVDSIAALFRSAHTTSSPTAPRQIHAKRTTIKDKNEMERPEYSIFDRSKELLELGAYLKKLAHNYTLAVVAINQVTDVFDNTLIGIDQVYSKGRMVRPCLGMSWSVCVNTRIFLSRNMNISSSSLSSETKRALHLMWSPSRKACNVPFELKTSGIESLL